MLNRGVETTCFSKELENNYIFFQRLGKTNYLFQTFFSTKKNPLDIHASPQNIKWLLSKLCVKKNKRCYTYLLHFSTCKHNLVFFFRILTVELHRIFLYMFFFQEKTLGDISFKLETKIMNFMSVFLLQKKI